MEFKYLKLEIFIPETHLEQLQAVIDGLAEEHGAAVLWDSPLSETD